MQPAHCGVEQGAPAVAAGAHVVAVSAGLAELEGSTNQVGECDAKGAGV